MPFELNFGRIQVARSGDAAAPGGRFRLAVLGDFSARANRGSLERGEALAQRKALKVDVDNFDKVLQRLALKLTLQLGESAVELPIGSLEDFHPEQLFSNLEIFSELAGLRQRLQTASGFAKAAAEIQQWSGSSAAPVPPASARGSVLPAEGELSDFALLVGQPSVSPREETPLADLLRQVVGPYVVPAKDPRQDALVASVDEALSATMRTVLHHPDFQALESLWRAVDLLVRRLETGPKLEVVLIDLSAEELAAELSGAESLETTGVYKLLVEQPAADAHGGPYSALIAHYTFSRTRAHAELLGRLAKVASAIPAAAVAAMAPVVLEENPKDIPPEVAESWAALAALPEAAYVSLVTPSFLLRQPYGKRSEPVDCFDFEEITNKTGLCGFLWGNSAVLAGLLLGETAAEQGSKMSPGSRLAVGDLPFYYFIDQDGDQEALPCTEKLVTSREAALATSQGFSPVVSLKGSPEVRLGGFHSVAGGPLAGPWAPLAAVASDAPAPAPAVPAAPTEMPAAAPAPESSGDAELDALLAGLDTPEPAPPPPEPNPPSETPAPPADSEMDALLAGLDTLAPEPEPQPQPESPAESPPEPAPATPASADAEMDALLSGLDAPPAPAPASAEAPPAPASAGDPEMDALLAGLDEPAPASAPAAPPPPPAPEPAVAPPPAPAAEAPPAEPGEAPDATGDADLDALLASLAPDEAADPSPAETQPGDLDPRLRELLGGL